MTALQNLIKADIKRNQVTTKDGALKPELCAFLLIFGLKKDNANVKNKLNNDIYIEG